MKEALMVAQEQVSVALPIPQSIDLIETEPVSIGRRFISSRIGQAVVSTLAAVGIVAGNTAPAASAESGPVYTITGTNGDGAWLHGDPGLGDSGDLLKVMPEGTQFVADCLVYDSPIGPKQNPIWLHGKDETGAAGFVTDYYTSSKWDRNNTLEGQGIQVCGQEQKSQTSAVQPSLQNHEANPQNNGRYDRSRAVSWALANAEMQPPADGSCTWFASNVLWQGGLPKTDEWTSEGAYGNKVKTILGSELSGTYAAWNVQAFNIYLRETYPRSVWKELDFSANVISDAKPGSLIFYDWGEGEGLSHVSVVVGIAPGLYPEVAEWSAGPNGSDPTPYVKRGWTWSRVSNKWLQSKFPHIRAYLLDINTADMKLER